MPVTSGTVYKVDAASKSFSLNTPPTPPGTPHIAFVDATNDEWLIVVTAWGAGKSITVDSGPTGAPGSTADSVGR